MVGTAPQPWLASAYFASGQLGNHRLKYTDPTSFLTILLRELRSYGSTDSAAADQQLPRIQLPRILPTPLKRFLHHPNSDSAPGPLLIVPFQHKPVIMSASTSIQNRTFTTTAQKPYTYLTTGHSTGPLLIFLHGWPCVALTWKRQLLSLSTLGFYCVAPDMPGYGGTWTSTDSSDFALEKIVPDLLELLEHLGRKEAVWIGHDWGCGPLYALASHHPDVCRAIVGISVPYRTIEFGLEALIETVDRDLYPEDEFPNGQWDYQVFYEQDPKATDKQFESDVARYLKVLFSRGSAAAGKAQAPTSAVTKHKGWFGGPAAELPDVPLEKTVLDQEIFDAMVASVEKNGWHGATAWYLNHAANRQYTVEKSVNEGKLEMPVLFVHTEYDSVCQTVYNPKIMKEMRQSCRNLTEFVIKTGHSGQLECPEMVNSGIVEWVGKEVKESWPGPELKSRL